MQRLAACSLRSSCCPSGLSGLLCQGAFQLVSIILHCSVVSLVWCPSTPGAGLCICPWTSVVPVTSFTHPAWVPLRSSPALQCMNFELLTGKFSTHLVISLCNACCPGLTTKILWDAVLKVILQSRRRSIYCCCLVHQDRCFLMEDNQVNETEFVFFRCILAVPILSCLSGPWKYIPERFVLWSLWAVRLGFFSRL